MARIDKTNYYLDIAGTVLERSTCMRRHYGAIIVQDDEIVSSGYNGAPRGRRNCGDLGYCAREALNIPSGERYELCRSVHAEANAIISAPRREVLGATLYMACKDPATGELVPGSTSCSMCRRLIINAGIARVVIRDTAAEYRVVDVEKEWIEDDDSIPEHLRNPDA
jgi:dCMP deaminase